MSSSIPLSGKSAKIAAKLWQDDEVTSVSFSTRSGYRVQYADGRKLAIPEAVYRNILLNDAGDWR